jgi:hypothetical protein
MIALTLAPAWSTVAHGEDDDSQLFRMVVPLKPAPKPATPKPARPEPLKPAEYKQEDRNFYLKSDVLKANPDAVILPMTAVKHTGESWFVPMHRHPAKEVYLMQATDWVEPITPPNMPPNLNIPLDAMQVREPHGDVQVALPSAPANFTAVTDLMTLPNGSVLKTGGSGTVAVLFGGVDSVRLAPNSQAAVQMNVTPALRDTEVDLHDGVAFSKVGLRLGEKESYQVHTPFGVVSAHGTDFATVALPQRVDVWVATGTVQLLPPGGDGAKAQSVTAEAKGPLRVMRYPVAKDAQSASMENAETLSSALQIIPMINQKLKMLGDRVAAGDKLNPRESDYLGRVRRVAYLTKLTYVPPPTPPPAPVVILPAPKPKPAQTVAKTNTLPPPTTPVTSPAKMAKPSDAASAAYVDPNSLAPKKSLPKAALTTSTTEGDAPAVRPSKMPLDLRDQDSSTNSTIP